MPYILNKLVGMTKTFLSILLNTKRVSRVIFFLLNCKNVERKINLPTKRKNSWYILICMRLEASENGQSTWRKFVVRINV